MKYEIKEGAHGNDLLAARDRAKMVLDDCRRHSTHTSENLWTFTFKSAVRGPRLDQERMTSYDFIQGCSYTHPRSDVSYAPQKGAEAQLFFEISHFLDNLKSEWKLSIRSLSWGSRL